MRIRMPVKLGFKTHVVIDGCRGVELKPEILAYLNRLSDVLWLFGRLIEVNAGVDARLRSGETAGPKWSRAWK